MNFEPRRLFRKLRYRRNSQWRNIVNLREKIHDGPRKITKNVKKIPRFSQISPKCSKKLPEKFSLVFSLCELVSDFFLIFWNSSFFFESRSEFWGFLNLILRDPRRSREDKLGRRPTRADPRGGTSERAPKNPQFPLKIDDFIPKKGGERTDEQTRNP